jgi:hypothetical protein
MLRSYGRLGAAAFLLMCTGSASAEEADRPMLWRVQQRCNVAGCQILLDQCAAGCRAVGPNSYAGCMGSCRTRFQSCVQAACQRR